MTPEAALKLEAMTPSQFELQVFEKKRQLVILDNLVLDVKGYEHHHPGGRFVMQRNIGRDISKFFYGGYSMMAGRQPQKVHSIQALSIAKRMVVGYIEK